MNDSAIDNQPYGVVPGGVMDKRICAAVEATEAVGDDMEQANEVLIPVPGIDTSAPDLTDAQRTLIRAGLLRGSAQTAWVLERMLTAAQAALSKPWEHSEHWLNPETGQVECECCCRWALEAKQMADDHEAAQATIALEHAALLKANEELAKRDSEWMDSAGKFRMALHEHGLHGHYNLFQEWEWPVALASTAPVAAQKEGEQ